MTLIVNLVRTDLSAEITFEAFCIFQEKQIATET